MTFAPRAIPGCPDLSLPSVGRMGHPLLHAKRGVIPHPSSLALLVEDVLANPGDGLLVFRPVGLDMGRMIEHHTV